LHKFLLIFKVGPLEVLFLSQYSFNPLKRYKMKPFNDIQQNKFHMVMTKRKQKVDQPEGLPIIVK